MNNKLTTKNWQRVRLNSTTKSITFTNDTTYKTESECLVDIKSNQYIAINKRRFDKMISEGYEVVDSVTKSTRNITESIQTIDLTGNPETEESIRKYYVMKKQRQGVQFVKGLHVINEKSKVSAVDVFGESKFDKVRPLTFHKAYDKFERTELGRMRKAELQQMEVSQ